MTKKLDKDELESVSGAGQDASTPNVDRLDADAPDGGGGGDRPAPVDIQSPGLQDAQPE